MRYWRAFSSPVASTIVDHWMSRSTEGCSSGLIRDYLNGDLQARKSGILNEYQKKMLDRLCTSIQRIDLTRQKGLAERGHLAICQVNDNLARGRSATMLPAVAKEFLETISFRAPV